MHRYLPVWLVLTLLGTATIAHGQTNGIREVTASERSLVTLHTKLRYTTMVVLPEGETIVDVICGDRDFWVISATHNIVHIKPAKDGAQTNLNLVATSGTIYSFLLAEGKGVYGPDLKVYVTGDAPMIAANGKPKYYTAAAVEALEAELRRAHGEVDAAQTAARTTIAEARNEAPLAMRFDYDAVPYTKPFLIRAIWHDGRFTYIKTDAKELPSLYELKDGEPALVNFQTPRPDIYVVPKVLDAGYFMLGKARLAFRLGGRRGE